MKGGTADRAPCTEPPGRVSDQGTEAERPGCARIDQWPGRGRRSDDLVDHPMLYDRGHRKQGGSERGQDDGNRQVGAQPGHG